jgi:hypothetical protein
MLILLWNKSRPKFCISNVGLGYFYFNVNFYIGYSKDI